MAPSKNNQEQTPYRGNNPGLECEFTSISTQRVQYTCQGSLEFDLPLTESKWSLIIPLVTRCRLQQKSASKIHQKCLVSSVRGLDPGLESPIRPGDLLQTYHYQPSALILHPVKAGRLAGDLGSRGITHATDIPLALICAPEIRIGLLSSVVGPCLWVKYTSLQYNNISMNLIVVVFSRYCYTCLLESTMEFSSVRLSQYDRFGWRCAPEK